MVRRSKGNVLLEKHVLFGEEIYWGINSLPKGKVWSARASGTRLSKGEEIMKYIQILRNILNRSLKFNKEK